MIPSGLQGKTVLVTGGSRGIGRAIVELFAGEGAHVTFFYRGNAQAADAVVASLAASGHTVHAEQVDVTDAPACVAAVEALADRAGRIDVLVNNAGVIRDNPLTGLDDDDIRTVLDTNIGGVFNVTRAVVPYMVMQRAGAIVNLSSVAGDKGGRGQTNYAASKGAVNAFTRALAVELAPRKIRVNAVAPGTIATELAAKAVLTSEEAKARIMSRTPMKRLGEPSEVADAVAWLASDAASYVTGEIVVVDGGRMTLNYTVPS